MLVIEDLHVSYGAIRAIHGVSLRVNEGEIVTLIGSNGAGKTTTLRAISGMCKVAQGRVKYLGNDITGMQPHEIVRRGLAQSPEGRGIFANLSVQENLDMGAFTRKDHAGIKSDMEKVYGLFPRLKERLKQNAGTLSGGEQQMLAIGRAVLAKPRLLLLDEPSLGLAPQVVQTIFRIIREINAGGTTILLVEQNASMALALAHRAYVLEVGSIAMEGPAKELAKSDMVRKAYLGHG